jgi:hypothetical protein
MLVDWIDPAELVVGNILGTVESAAEDYLKGFVVIKSTAW